MSLKQMTDKKKPITIQHIKQMSKNKYKIHKQKHMNTITKS